jgi:4-amino-4-deoxy-L-arabinose transferase-like glycosyltransferase
MSKDHPGELPSHDPPRRESRPAAWFGAGLLLIAIAGAALRIWGIDFGLPFLYHPHEAEIVDRALALPRQDFNPRWFAYPTLYLYIQAAAYLALYAGMRLGGSVASYGSFLAVSAQDPTALYTVGRSVTATLGAATIAVTGLAARRLGASAPGSGVAIGLAAAALLCLAPLHVEHSHYITTDVPLALFASLVLLQAGSMASSGGTVRQYALAGALVGAAASVGYPGALLGLLIAALYVQQAIGNPITAIVRDVRPLAACGCAVAAFLAGTPFALLDFNAFARGVRLGPEHAQGSYLGFEPAADGWLAHLGTVYGSGGLVFLVFLAAGMFALLWRRERLGRATVITLLALLIIAAVSRSFYARYLILLLPTACAVAAYGLVSTAAHLRRPGALRSLLVVFLLLVTCLVPASGAYHRLRLLTAGDTRTLAWRWAAGLSERDGDPIVLAIERNAIPEAAAAPLPNVSLTPVVYDLDAVRTSTARYVAVTESVYQLHLRAPERHPAEVAFYGGLLARARLVKVFSPYSGDACRLVQSPTGEPRVAPAPSGTAWASLARRLLAGPVIEIYELRPSE